MKKIDENTIGYRIRDLRKQKGYNQQELADILGKSLRTIQKYENGEIEISVSMINELAKVLDTTSMYLLGYKTETATREITTFADIVAMMFELEKVMGLKFDVDVKRPPKDDNWECSLKFYGKVKTDFNADMCLFLEDWADMRKENHEQYEQWKDRTIAYYSMVNLKTETEESDNTITKKIPSEDLTEIQVT